MAGLTLTGFDRKTLETIQAEIVADLRASISPSLNTEAAALIGNFAGIFASKLSEVWELLEAMYRATDRNGASGNALDVIGSLIGVPRDPALPSTVAATVVVGAGFSAAPRTMIASVAGNPSARFVNSAAVSSVAGGTLTGIAFEGETAGPVEAPSGTLTVIANPLSGWTSITNPLDASIGSEVESDLAYRVRQIAELAKVGSTTVDAIRADTLAVAGVESVTVLENDTDATDGNGLKPHSVEAIVLGGVTADVAQAIFASKAGGIGTNGSTSQAVTDSQGRSHTIKLTRPAEILLYLEITVYADLSKWAGAATTKTTIVEWAQANLEVGEDLIKNQIVAVIMGMTGVVDVNITGVDDVTPTVTSANYAIGIREIARLDTSRITITGVAA